jgi:DNA-binding NarL/FixJ family response regulator
VRVGSAVVVNRVREACRDVSDSRALRIRVLDAVRAVVGFDAYAWLLTDPGTTVGTAPLADVPCLPELPTLIRLKYLDPVNRWTTLTPGVPAALASESPGSSGWRAFLQEYGVGDVASVVFADGFGSWGFLDLWRTAPGTYDARELADLQTLLAPVTQALRRCQAATFAEPAATWPAAPGPAVLLLSPELDVRQQTGETGAYLRQLLPTEQDRQPVPAGAYNVAAQLLAAEAGVDNHPATARAHLADGRWLTFRAARLLTSEPEGHRDIAVTIEPVAPRERLAIFTRVHALTERETRVLECLADGDDTRAVAGRLFLSEFTVQDHLKSVFDKTGVRCRGSLLARATGTG